MASGGLQPKSVGPQIHILIMIPFCVPVVSVTHGLLLAALWAYLKVSGVSTQSPQSSLLQFCLLNTTLSEMITLLKHIYLPIIPALEGQGAD